MPSPANLPFGDFSANEVWLEIVLTAQDLLAWAQALVLDGELSLAEPKRLRQRWDDDEGLPGPT